MAFERSFTGGIFVAVSTVFVL